ncbi:MAG: hypothetical protein KF702_11245 [Gammaproteobacteria bacterium]|nr:hypothetical protein [Gammaproteobacteria bacterium]
MNPREEETSHKEISPFAVWAAKNLKDRGDNKGNNEVRIKELLYRISPHLHPRIVESLSFDSNNSTLKIDINKKASQEFVDRIMHDLQKFKPQQQGGSLTISVPETDFESIVEKKYSLDREEHYVGFARDIKDTTDAFDYEIIERKPSGRTKGVKLGNAYIKKMDLSKKDLLDFFTYITLHHFLGTKSPQVDLIKDKKNNVWMVSRSLSQTYSKQDKVKTKKFERADNSLSVFDKNINMKSVGKLILLAALFRLTDLHSENIGIVSSEHTSKLSIVDYTSSQRASSLDFSGATSWKMLFSLLENKYKNLVPDRIKKLIDELRIDIPSFVAATHAILQPLTENIDKTKSIFYVGKERTIFEKKSETFAKAVETSYRETLEKLKKIGFHPSSTEFDSSLHTKDRYTIEEILENQKKMFIEAGLNLEGAVNSITKKDADIQEALINYDADLIEKLMERREDFSDNIGAAINVAINKKNERFLYYLFKQIDIFNFFKKNPVYVQHLFNQHLIGPLNVIHQSGYNLFKSHQNELFALNGDSFFDFIVACQNNIGSRDFAKYVNDYLLQHQNDLPVIRHRLLELKKTNEDMAEQFLNTLSMINQLNLFCAHDNGIRDSIELYSNTNQFSNVLSDYFQSQISTFTQLIVFISELSKSGIDQTRLWKNKDRIAKIKNFLMNDLTSMNIIFALDHVPEFHFSPEELIHFLTKLNLDDFLFVLEHVIKRKPQDEFIVHNIMGSNDFVKYVNNYLIQYQNNLPAIRQRLLALKDRHEKIAEKFLNALSMINRMNLFCLSDNDIYAGIKLYANTSQFSKILSDYFQYRISTFAQLTQFISALSKSGIDQAQLLKLQEKVGIEKIKSFLMSEPTLINISFAFENVPEFNLSSDELIVIAQKSNSKDFLDVLEIVKKYNTSQITINDLAHDAIIVCLNNAVEENNLETVKSCLAYVDSKEVNIESNEKISKTNSPTFHYLKMHNINIKLHSNKISELDLVACIQGMQSCINFLKKSHDSAPFTTLCTNLLNVYSEYKTQVGIITPGRLNNLWELVSQVGQACYLYMNSENTNSSFGILEKNASRLCHQVTEAHKKEGALFFTSEVISAIPLPFFQNLKNPSGFLSSKLSTLIQEAIDKSKTTDISLKSSQ